MSAADPGFSIGGRQPHRGGANSRGGYVSKILYVKTKESGPLGGAHAGGTPPGSTTACSVHTEERGYEWIIFRRQPDRKIYSSDDDNKEDSTTESTSDDDVFFSAEAEDALLDQRTDSTEPSPEDKRNMEQENSSADVSDGKEKAKPQMFNQPCESSLHSRKNRGETSTSNHQSHQKKKKNKTKKEKEKNKSIGTSVTVETFRTSRTSRTF